MNERQAITRREIVRLAGAAGVVFVALPEWLGGLAAHASTAAARSVTTAAVLTPELTEGPYWVNTMLRRSDVRANTRSAKVAPGVAQAGMPLSLTINVLDASDSGKPLNGVAVDIWHANAHGIYSDEGSQQSGRGAAGADTTGQNFLRGYQITGEDGGLRGSPVAGQVSFTTIWPGWYAGRAIHIHVRVRRLATSGATIAGYTTQIFFSDADNDRVLTGAAPYSTRAPQKDPTTDENDMVLQAADRATNIVPVTGNLATGFAATFTMMLDAAETTLEGSLARPSAAIPSGAPPGGKGTPP